MFSIGRTGTDIFALAGTDQFLYNPYRSDLFTSVADPDPVGFFHKKSYKAASYLFFVNCILSWTDAYFDHINTSIKKLYFK